MTFHPKVERPEDLHRSSRSGPIDDGKPFAYTPEHRARLAEIEKSYPADRRRSVILAALYLVQFQQGYVTASAMRHVAETLGCTPAEVDDVASYYSMIDTARRGKYVVQVCRTLSCALVGAERLIDALAGALGAPIGGTDPTGTFTLVEAECLGGCDRGPIVLVNDTWHERVRPEDARAFADELRARGEAAQSGCHWQRADQR